MFIVVNGQVLKDNLVTLSPKCVLCYKTINVQGAFAL